MARRVWLDAWWQASLQRSTALAQEVLERTSRRINWTFNDDRTRPGASLASSSTHQHTTYQPATLLDSNKRGVAANLDQTLENVADILEEATCQCKWFYSTDACSEPSEMERRHMCRYHTQLLPIREHKRKVRREEKKVKREEKKVMREEKKVRGEREPETEHTKVVEKAVPRSTEGEDFYIEVPPGTYSITASAPQSQQLTQRVNVGAGESIRLTFAL